jgi:hypothetical protein
MWKSLDAETALASMYIMTRKGAELSTGPVTDALLAASETPLREAVARRIEFTREAFGRGQDLAGIVRTLDDERKNAVEQQAANLFSVMTGQEIKLRFTSVRPQSRRTDPFTRRYLGFDARFDAEVSVDGKVEVISNVFAEALPRVTRGGLNRLKRYMMAYMGQAMAKRGKVPNIIPGQEWLIPHMLDIPLTVAIVAGQEFTYASNCLLNIVVPAAVAVAAGKHSPEEAARIAEQAAYITATIPGAVMRARKIGDKVSEKLT